MGTGGCPIMSCIISKGGDLFMRKRLLFLCYVLALAFCNAGFADAAGPMGHFILGKKTIENINAGRYPAPQELKQLLRNPECRRAYCGGAVGPDICGEKSHYGNTADLAQKMLDAARSNMQKAAKARDEGAFNEAQKQVAFAYGWYNHCAVDLNVHPKINAAAGDAYVHNDKGQKAIHAAQETQLTAYLRKTIGKDYKYDVYVPYNFLSKIVGVDEANLRQMTATVNGKVAAELWSAGKVKLTLDQLRSIWGKSTKDSLQEIVTFLKDSRSMRNWDLDCGHISTQEFEDLRNMALSINDGKLPPGWGRNYLAWFNKLKGLTKEQQTALLAKLIKGTTKQTAVKKPPPPTGGKLRMDLQLELYVSYSGGYKDEQQTWPQRGFQAFENTGAWMCFIINEGGTFSGRRMDDDTESWVEGRRSADRIIELKWKNHEVSRTNGDKYREEWWEIELEDIPVNPMDRREYLLEGYDFGTGEYNVGFEKSVRKLEHIVTFYPSKKTITLQDIFFQISEVKKLDDLSGFGQLGHRPFVRVYIYNPGY